MNTTQIGWSLSHEPKLRTSRAAHHQERGVFAILRALVPRRLLNQYELTYVAELQANRLLELAGTLQFPVPNELITELPRVSVHLDPDLPVSGAAQWAGGRWRITVNGNEPWQRQRFTLAHELAHVLMHPFTEIVFAGPEAAEYAADVFAACLLMPRKELKRVWGEGMQSLPALAAHFGVSERAMAVRLRALGLRDSLPRHMTGAMITPPQPRRYERQASPTLVGAM